MKFKQVDFEGYGIVLLHLRIFLFILLPWGLGSILSAQTIERHLISPSSSYIRTDNLEIQWSLGEPIVAPTSVIATHVTQGFHQKTCVNPAIQFVPQSTQFCWYAPPLLLDFAQPNGGIWYGSGIILQNQQPYFAPAFATVGNYVLYYRYTDQQGCTGLDSLTLVVNACTGLQSEVSKNTIRLFPVPADRYLELSGTDIPIQVEVVSITGQIQFLTVQNGRISTEYLLNGVYYLKIGEVVFPFSVLHP
jgi:hypothetical protein